jgi:hypothetical protein
MRRAGYLHFLKTSVKPVAEDFNNTIIPTKSIKSIVYFVAFKKVLFNKFSGWGRQYFNTHNLHQK